MTIADKEKERFSWYVKSFYSTEDPTAIYPLAPPDVIEVACDLVSRRIDIPFDGDSVDRERVRYVLSMLGYEETR